MSQLIETYKDLKSYHRDLKKQVKRGFVPADVVMDQRSPGAIGMLLGQTSQTRIAVRYISIRGGRE